MAVQTNELIVSRALQYFLSFSSTFSVEAISFSNDSWMLVIFFAISAFQSQTFLVSLENLELTALSISFQSIVHFQPFHSQRTNSQILSCSEELKFFASKTFTCFSLLVHSSFFASSFVFLSTFSFLLLSVDSKDFVLFVSVLSAFSFEPSIHPSLKLLPSKSRLFFLPSSNSISSIFVLFNTIAEIIT
jgi:hypothetical protein